MKLGNIVDSLMGKDQTPCKPTDRYPLLLIEAGVDLLPGSPRFSVDTVLTELASPRDLQRVLGNLNTLYLTDHSLAEDILNNATIGDVIRHLDAAQVDFAIEKVKEHEKDAVITSTRESLDDLNSNISSAA